MLSFIHFAVNGRISHFYGWMLFHYVYMPQENPYIRYKHIPVIKKGTEQECNIWDKMKEKYMHI